MSSSLMDREAALTVMRGRGGGVVCLSAVMKLRYHGNSPVFRFGSVGITDVLGFIVQPAVWLHGVFVWNLSRSVFVPGGQRDK